MKPGVKKRERKSKVKYGGNNNVEKYDKAIFFLHKNNELYPEYSSEHYGNERKISVLIHCVWKN
jgi:hypothetical protein